MGIKSSEKWNDNFFQNIDNEAKAYFLGFLFADGNIYLRLGNRNPVLQCALQKRDSYILKKFLQELNSKNKIYKDKTKKYRSIIISSNKLCTDLINLGCVPCKSLILEWPKNLSSHLEYHFIRGYFDGDGTVTSSTCGRHTNPQYRISFCGTYNFLSKISKILNKSCKFFPSIPRQYNNIYRLDYCGNKNIKKFYDYFYKDANIFLKRKHNKMKEVFKIIPYK